jgi:hypothetical protein
MNWQLIARMLAVRHARRNLVRFVVAAWATLILGLGPSLGTVQAASSHAVTIKNHSDTIAWVAVAYKWGDFCDSDYYTVAGWWKLVPGQSETWYTSSSHFYYYADGADGGYWDGTVGTYVTDDGPFKRCEPTESSDLPFPDAPPGYYRVEMVDLYVGPYDTYTRNLLD